MKLQESLYCFIISRPHIFVLSANANSTQQRIYHFCQIMHLLLVSFDVPAEELYLSKLILNLKKVLKRSCEYVVERLVKYLFMWNPRTRNVEQHS